jgi:Transposase
MRSRLEPLKKVARILRGHRELILNWFEAKGTMSSGAVEGLNNMVKVVTRRSYGFRTLRVAKLARFHTLGHLPESDDGHRFCGRGKYRSRSARFPSSVLLVESFDPLDCLNGTDPRRDSDERFRIPCW